MEFLGYFLAVAATLVAVGFALALQRANAQTVRAKARVTDDSAREALLQEARAEVAQLREELETARRMRDAVPVSTPFVAPSAPAAPAVPVLTLTTTTTAPRAEPAVVSAEGAGEAEKAIPTTPRPRRTPVVATVALLVAQEEATRRALTVSRLTAAGYEVREVGADTLLSVASAERPAAVVLDSALVGPPDGWEMLAAFKADAGLRDTPVVLLCPARDRERAMEQGAAGTLAETDSESVLLSTVKATLKEQKRRAERTRLAAKMAA